MAAGPIVKRTLRLRLRLAFISPFPPQHHPTQQSGNGSSDLEAVGLLRFLLTAIYLEPELLYMCTVVRPIFKTRARPVDLPRAVTGDDFALFRFCFPSTARLLPRSHSLFVAAPGSFCSPVFVLPFFIHSPSLSSCFSRISVTMVTHHDLLFHFLPPPAIRRETPRIQNTDAIAGNATHSAPYASHRNGRGVLAA